MVVHRIDHFASGALLFAKAGPDRDVLVRQFLDHTPVGSISRYSAAVSALRQGRSCTIFDVKECFNSCARRETPKRLVPNFDIPVERLFADASLVRVELVTGLQNQVRAQFSAMGYSVIGDRKYHRSESSEQLIARVALHAAYLQFAHPRSGQSVSIDCKLPPDFQHLVRELSRSSRARR